MIEDTSNIENECERLGAAVEQMQKDLVTMWSTKEQSKDNAQDRIYTGRPAGAKAPRRDETARNANAADGHERSRSYERGRPNDRAGAVDRRKRTRMCNVCVYSW